MLFPQLKSGKIESESKPITSIMTFWASKNVKIFPSTDFWWWLNHLLKTYAHQLENQECIFLVLDIYKELYQTNTLEAMVAVCEISGRLLYIYPHHTTVERVGYPACSSFRARLVTSPSSAKHWKPTDSTVAGKVERF